MAVNYVRVFFPSAALVETGGTPVKQAGCSLLVKIIIGITVSTVIVAGAASAGYFLTVDTNTKNVKGNIQLNSSTTEPFSGQTTTDITDQPASGQTTNEATIDHTTQISNSRNTDSNLGEQTTGAGQPGQTTGAGQPGQTTDIGQPGQSTGAGQPGQTTGAGLAGQTTGVSQPGQTTGDNLPGQTTGAGQPGQTTGAGQPGQTTGANIVGQNSGQTNEVLNTGITNPPPSVNSSQTSGQIGNASTPLSGSTTSSSDNITGGTSPNLGASTTTPPTTVRTTPTGPVCPDGYVRTVIFSEYRGNSVNLWLRGADIPLIHLQSADSGYNRFARGDTKLDWTGKEAGQVAEAKGTPTTRTTNELTSPSYHPLNTFGTDYWITDACLDCTGTGNNRFQLKMFSFDWENVNGGDSNCFNGGNHYAMCGKINVFKYGITSCQINDFPNQNA
ncbi:hypothetical protein LOTGIDRAFT_158293 [Lottia gigantea]|uniref:Uncharacterized protein n=1 Tax=Lottia gigantea TaxID=225164 RepID=V4AYC7_LOTGI|nr:hypothetical protein LOTGIDRAFT_158293 [Lottia gigantea]ESP00061.1 hypothetical protein LOTGIDRAFT_158293 [Lottia gigantea]